MHGVKNRESAKNQPNNKCIGPPIRAKMYAGRVAAIVTALTAAARLHAAAAE